MWASSRDHGCRSNAVIFDNGAGWSLRGYSNRTTTYSFTLTLIYSICTCLTHSRGHYSHSDHHRFNDCSSNSTSTYSQFHPNCTQPFFHLSNDLLRILTLSLTLALTFTFTLALTIAFTPTLAWPPSSLKPNHPLFFLLMLHIVFCCVMFLLSLEWLCSCTLDSDKIFKRKEVKRALSLMLVDDEMNSCKMFLIVNTSHCRSQIALNTQLEQGK